MMNVRVAEAPSTTTAGEDTILPYNSGRTRSGGCSGPCPVMRPAPDPQCADKPYATTVTAHRDGVKRHLHARNRMQTAHLTSLPPGSYTLIAAGGTMLPRAVALYLSLLLQSGYATTTISCDTGSPLVFAQCAMINCVNRITYRYESP